MGVLDLLFPRRCVNCRKSGSYLCTSCFAYLSFDPERTCLMCNNASLDGLTHPGCRERWGIEGAFAALAYTGVVKKLVFTFKYRPYVSDIGELLGELFYEGIIQNEQFMKRMGRETVLIPVPLHKDKLRKRGYNHAEILTKQLAYKLGLEVSDQVVRVGKTKSQFLLKKDEREDNVRQAFALKKEGIIDYKDKTIFLVDDIVTTGATLKEITKLLKKAGATEVYGLTLAHGS